MYLRDIVQLTNSSRYPTKEMNPLKTMMIFMYNTD